MVGIGGRGGDIVIRGNKNLWTLINFKFQQHFRAEHGGDGGANRSTGADGNSVYLEVPLGTIVKDALTDEVLFEITEDKEEKIALKGGKEDWVTGIFALQPTRLHAMPSWNPRRREGTALGTQGTCRCWIGRLS